MTDIAIECLFGEMKLEPVKYWITSKEVEVKRWFPPWRSTRMEYYLESEFMSLGPFDTEGEIKVHCIRAGMSLTSH